MRNDNAGGDPGDSIRVTSVTQPGMERSAIGVGGSNVIYTPAPDTWIQSSQFFTYTITDSGGLTSTAIVEVFIEPPTRPFATDDAAAVAQNGSQIVIDVLSNDLASVGATNAC